MNKQIKFLQVFSIFICTISLFLSVVDFCCFYQPFYESQYQKNNTTQATGLNEEDLMRATTTLFDYLHDVRDDLVVEANVNGNQREVFDEREKAHMVDVKGLYLNAMRVRNYLGILGILLLFLTLLFTDKNRLQHLYHSYKIGVGLFFSVILALGIFALIDFNTFWTNFHHIFFSNDLWILDPNTEILINMVPEPFFFSLVFFIVLLFFGLLFLCFIFLRLLSRKVNA